MPGLELVVGVAGALQVLLLGYVGLRMLHVARRTGHWPERWLGISFLASNGIGYPLMMAAGMAGERAVDVQLLAFALALAAIDVGAVGFACFVGLTFRPSSEITRWNLRMVAAVAVIHLVGATSSLAAAAPDATPMEALGSWTLVMNALLMVPFAWGTVESVTWHRRLRRQLALGIGDPALVERFGWFTVGCAAPLAMMAFVGVAAASGTNPVGQPLHAVVIATGSLMAGASMVLALCPPAWAPRGAAGGSHG